MNDALNIDMTHRVKKSTGPRSRYPLLYSMLDPGYHQDIESIYSLH